MTLLTKKVLRSNTDIVPWTYFALIVKPTHITLKLSHVFTVFCWKLSSAQTAILTGRFVFVKQILDFQINLLIDFNDVAVPLNYINISLLLYIYINDFSNSMKSRHKIYSKKKTMLCVLCQLPHFNFWPSRLSGTIHGGTNILKIWQIQNF